MLILVLSQFYSIALSQVRKEHLMYQVSTITGQLFRLMLRDRFGQAVSVTLSLPAVKVPTLGGSLSLINFLDSVRDF
jgi:hypothetical protein